MENDKIIVVFGGSFNPPLNSHFSLAEQKRRKDNFCTSKSKISKERFTRK